jgi:hypothetical protein
MHRPQREKVHAKSDNITDGLTLSIHWASYLLLQAFQLHLRQLYPFEMRLSNTPVIQLSALNIKSANFRASRLLGTSTHQGGSCDPESKS